MANTRLPGDLPAGSKTAFGGPYPIHPGNTGFNNIEVATYPSPTTDLIMPVISPVDPAKIAIRYECRAGSPQPHYGSAGERSEIWWESHDRKDGSLDAVCASFWIPADFYAGEGWFTPWQLHAADGWESDPNYDGDPSPPYALGLFNGKVTFQQKYVKTHDFGPVLLGRELFIQWELKHSKTNGQARLWVQWDTPPAADQPPRVSWGGQTHWGGNQYYKTGIYRGKTKAGTSVIYGTAWAFDDTGNLAAARAVAGWGAGTPPPPPPPPIPKITGSIAQNAEIGGNVSWTADNGPMDFYIDGVKVWHENNPPYVCNGDGAALDTHTLSNGSHTFRVALSDGTAFHEVVATVKNGVTPPPPDPTNAELRDKGVAALKLTTVTYPQWEKNVQAGKYPALGPPSQWGIAFEAFSKIK